MRFFLLFFLFNFSLHAQKANFKAAEKFSQKSLSEMLKTTRVSPKWFHESDKFWYSYTTTNGKHFYVVDPIKKTKTKMLDNLDFSAKLSELTRKYANTIQCNSQLYNLLLLMSMLQQEIEHLKYELDYLF